MAFFPVFWLLSTSFKPYEEWASSPPHWLPAKPTLQNYRIVFAPEAARRFAAKQSGSLDYKVSGSAWAAFGTSALVSTVATFLSVLAGTLVSRVFDLPVPHWGPHIRFSVFVCSHVSADRCGGPDGGALFDAATY
jgi:ABC-type glycerol-3-phosphate transport system permease component